MGKQSSRLYYQGKDHKDIYFQGHYHDAMYIGSQLVWEKLDGKIEPILYEDVSVGIPESSRKRHVKNMVSTIFGSVVFQRLDSNDYARNGSAYLFYYKPSWDYWDYSISGQNTAFYRGHTIVFPDGNIIISNPDVIGRPVYAFDGFLIPETHVNVDAGALVDTTAKVNTGGLMERGIQFYVNGSAVSRDDYFKYCNIEIGLSFSQYFLGRIHADVTVRDREHGYFNEICSSTDGINWTSDNRIKKEGTVIGTYLFYDDGTAINQNYENISYTRKPAIYVNDWYYAEELERGYLMRSKNLVDWQRYKNISASNDYTVSGYWRTKNLLCLKKAEDDESGEAGIYKYKIHL